MATENVQDLVETALEAAIDSLNLIATDRNLDRRLFETREMCNRALVELRGYGHDAAHEEWSNSQENGE